MKIINLIDRLIFTLEIYLLSKIARDLKKINFFSLQIQTNWLKILIDVKNF